MNSVQRIAFFGGNVHILYVPEKVQNCMLLLYLLTFQKPKNLRLPENLSKKVKDLRFFSVRFPA